VRGTGLGLFICRRIINAHGGEITAESILGDGTTFHIFLPLDQSKRTPAYKTPINQEARQ
jgi:signal transduction histidine kinase